VPPDQSCFEQRSGAMDDEPRNRRRSVVRWSLWPLSYCITPPSGIWHMLCSDQTWLSHNSAIPKQQMRRAFSSLGFKQVCDVLGRGTLETMCVLSVAAPPSAACHEY
jgi:hypothetical protein